MSSKGNYSPGKCSLCTKPIDSGCVCLQCANTLIKATKNNLNELVEENRKRKQRRKSRAISLFFILLLAGLFVSLVYFAIKNPANPLSPAETIAFFVCWVYTGTMAGFILVRWVENWAGEGWEFEGKKS